MSETQTTPRVPTKFTTSLGSAADLEFNKPVGRTGSQYDALVEAVKQLRPGSPPLVIAPEAGMEAKTLRNRITAPIRKKAEPTVKTNGGRLRIRINKAGAVVVQCVELAAEAAEGDEDAAAE